MMPTLRSSHILSFILLLLINCSFAYADSSNDQLSSAQGIKAADEYYQKYFLNESKSSTALERLEKKVHAKQAFDNKDWYSSRYALQKVLADNEHDFQAWFLLCKSLIELQQYSYEHNEEALKTALTKAYQHASSTLDRKSVELIAEFKQSTLKDSKQSDIENHILEIINTFPSEFAPYALEIPERTDIASACILWSYPLVKSEHLHYEDYINIKPAVKDLNITAKANRLCIEGLTFGENYQISFKKDLPGVANRTLLDPQTISVFIPHRKPAISFREKGYILPSHAPQHIPLTAVNVSEVKLKIIHIPENNIQNVQQNWFTNQISRWETHNLQEEQGSLVWQGTYRFPIETDKTALSGIPIDEILGKKLEPGVYVIEAWITEDSYAENEFASQALVISDLGLTTYQGPDGLHVFVKSLKNAKPLSDVEIKLISRNNRELSKLKTNNKGHAIIAENMLNGKGGNQPAFLSALYKGKQFTVLNLRNDGLDLSDRGNQGKTYKTNVDAFITTERGIYRTGETVHFLSLLRNTQGKALCGNPLLLKIYRPDGVLAEELSLQDKGNGSYVYDYQINSTAQSGLWTASIYLDPKESLNQVSFEVNDFVPPRIEVKSTGTDKPIIPFESTTIHVSAQYYYGPFANNLNVAAESKLVIMSEPFPKWKAYHFGLEEENWIPQRFKHLDTQTDQNGQAHIDVQIEAQVQTTHPLQVETNIQVYEIGGRARKIKHLSPFWHQAYMIGISPRFKDKIAKNDSDAIFDIIAVNKLGILETKSDLRYTLYEEQYDYVWFRQGNQWQYETVTRDKVITTGKLSLKSTNPQELKVPVKYGSYRIEILDDKTGIASSLRFSAGWHYSPNAPDKPDMLELVFENSPTSQHHAKIHVKSPFQGELFLAWAGETLTPIYQKPISVEATSLEIPIPADLNANGQYLVATVYGTGNESNPMPKRAMGIAWFENKSLLKQHHLDLTIQHPEKIHSNQTVDILIKTKNNKSKTHLIVALVDEGTLSLTNFKTPDPYQFFFAQKQLSYQIRDNYGLLINPYGTHPGSFEVGGGESILNNALTQLPARAFKVVSLFSGIVDTNNKEITKIQFNIPEYTGKFRVYALGWNENQLGMSQSTLVVQDPIDIYFALPRFLAPNDKATIPLIIKNLDANPGQYALTYQSADKTQTQTINLTKGSDLQIPFTLHFADNGIKNNQITLKGPNNFEIKRQWSLSVRPEIQAISLYQYGTIEPNQPLTLTPEILKSFKSQNSTATLTIGSLPEIGAQTLIKDLLAYPYACLEQTSSRLLAVLQNEKPDQNLLMQGYNQLATLQKLDGSFSLWPNGYTEAWLSLYVYDILSEAKDKKINLPPFMSNLNSWLIQVTQRSINTPEDISIVAYAHYLLAKSHLGQARQLRFFADNFKNQITQKQDRAFIAAAFAYYDSHQEAQAWFDSSIQAIETKRENEYSGFGSNLRNSAILVTLLAQTTINHPKLTHLVQELVDKSKTESYLSTQEKAWLIRASHALQDVQKTINLEYQGKTTQSSLPQNFHFKHQDLNNNPTIKNLSAKPVYYALSMQGEPLDVKALPQSGFEIQREIFTLSGEKVDLNHLVSGALYCVNIKGKRLNERLNHILLVDLLPAGFEIDNANLNDRTDQLSWLGSLTNTQQTEARDDRFVAAFDLWQQSEFNIAYIVRAVSMGTFSYPPSFIEAMYQPRFFAYSESQNIQVVQN